MIKNTKTEKNVMAGFDGYVDSILRVKKSQSCNGESYFETLTDFGDYIKNKSGKSGSLELSLVTEKLGGNMPIFSSALSAVNQSLSCIGAIGYPKVHPLFSSIGNKLVSVCQPGTCQALEFDDGKMMLARNEDIEAMDFNLLKERAGLKALIDLAEEADVIALLNWSELKGSTSIWQGYINEVIPRLTQKKRKLFVDISDCSHRSQEEICQMIRLLKDFSKTMELSISFNQNEAECVGKALDISKQNVEELAKELYEKVKCKKLVIHLSQRCICVFKGNIVSRENRFIEKPLISTGGGDNFNAGFVYGLLLNLEPTDCMTVANGFSSYYVSHGRSPNKVELINWLLEADNKEGK